LTPEQQAVTDPDFASEALLGEPISMLELQRLHLRRGALGSHLRQFMQRFDLLVTPTLAVPAFGARPAGHSAIDLVTMLGWTPFIRGQRQLVGDEVIVGRQRGCVATAGELDEFRVPANRAHRRGGEFVVGTAMGAAVSTISP